MSAITMYTTPTCGYCHMAKNYFTMKKIDFEIKDITKDPQAMQEVQDKSGQMGVPVIDIKGKVVVGFNRPVIDALMRQEGLV